VMGRLAPDHLYIRLSDRRRRLNATAICNGLAWETGPALLERNKVKLEIRLRKWLSNYRWSPSIVPSDIMMAFSDREVDGLVDHLSPFIERELLEAYMFHGD